MNQREFAELAGVSQPSVSVAIRDGRLDGALNPDRSIRDQALALKLFRGSSTRRTDGVQPASLAAARTRKLTAIAQKLAGEVDQLRSNAISPEVAQALAVEMMAPILVRLDRLAELAPDLAGLGEGPVHTKLRTEVARALTDIAALPEPHVTQPPATSRPTPKTPVEVDTHKITLSAELMELETALETGALIRIDDFAATFTTSLGDLRAALLSLPGRLAAQLSRLPPDKARFTLKAELTTALIDAGFATQRART